MKDKIETIKVPDIGDAKDVSVIEVQVKSGDKIAKEDSLITLEGDKATMEVPSPKSGVVKEVMVKKGDRISAGAEILRLEVSDEGDKSSNEMKERSVEKPAATSEEKPTESSASTAEEKIQKVNVPDIGDAQNIKVIEVLVKLGDTVEKDDSLVTLEGDKASMEVPSPFSGKIKELLLKVGDTVSAGDPILTMQSKEAAKTTEKESAKEIKKETKEESHQKTIKQVESEEAIVDIKGVHAGPSVRRTAREFDIDLTKIKGTGEKNRILKEDVQNYVKKQLQIAESTTKESGGWALPPLPQIDFSRYGEIEVKPLSKIQKISGPALHRNWINIPHVTQFAEADITELEEFRKQQKQRIDGKEIKLSPLVFVMKAVVNALRKFPHFNASLDPTGQNLIYKKYYHVGIAVDTENGLVVPVIRDVEKKGLFELAQELVEISQKAREVGLTMTEMQGGCFTISSLGGIGGSAFTPIINAPEVAILGISRAQMKPIYQANSSTEENEFVPRLMLPLSLSYDHRVIDGADGARFIVHLLQCLADTRTLLL